MRRAAAALFLVLLAPRPAPADETVRIGDLPAIANAGIYVATEQGFFKEKVPPETIKATIPFYIDPAARPRAQDIATFQDWFHQMGWVKEKAAMERIVDPVVPRVIG